MSTEKSYRVVWEIDISAESAEDAAKQAHEIQTSSMGVFECHSTVNGKDVVEMVDLDDSEWGE